jgi:O-antigen/teichoic acid export membrane protein
MNDEFGSAHRLSRNLAANVIGSVWTAGAQLLCAPLYLQLLGIEGYGLIGFYVMLRAALLVLDLGLATTVNRGFARMSVDTAQAQSMRDLARTLESGYWILGIILAVSLGAMAQYIAADWVNVRGLPPHVVVRTLAIMGVLIGLQWPLGFYQGGLMGLQRQVQLNALKILDVTLSTAGAVLVLRFVSNDISAFFEWQICVAVLHLTLIRCTLWRALPRGTRMPRIDVRLLGTLKSFAVGMSGISVFGLILGQMDKVVLSRLLSIEGFGYYVLADTLANGMYVFIAPVFGALYPRLTADVARGDFGGVRSLYHDGSQILAAFMAPLAAVLALCPVAVVIAWTGDAETARRVAPILSLLVTGTAINGIMQVPYALQLAFGWTRIGFVIRVCLVVVFLPLLVLMANSYGGLGAAYVWLLLNIVYFVVGILWTHRRLLLGDAWRWLILDVGLPSLTALGVVWLLRHLLSTSVGRIMLLVQLVGVVLASLVVSISVAPRLRATVSRIWGRRPARAVL